MTRNGQLTSWLIFLQALQTRFAPSQYEDPTRALFKLTQRSTVQAYLSEFEDLENWIIGLPPQFLLSCFIFNLTSEIHCEVRAYNRWRWYKQLTWPNSRKRRFSIVDAPSTANLTQFHLPPPWLLLRCFRCHPPPLCYPRRRSHSLLYLSRDCLLKS